MKSTPIYQVYDNGQLNVLISKGNMKLGNIPGFNTLPGDEPLTKADGTPLTNIKGTCGSVCKECAKHCYAIRSCRFHHNSTIKSYAANTLIMRNNPDKVRESINEYCAKNIVKYFRFHTAGEIESVEQLDLYATICRDNPDVVFYIYTKNFAALQDWFETLSERNDGIPENFVINLSEWHGNLEFIGKTGHDLFKECNIFSYDDGEDCHFSGHPHCPAIDKGGHETGVTCAQCRRCMRKGSITAVYAH